jgi:hypothetical protein
VTVLLRPASPGRSSALVALITAMLTGTGVVLATPVSVLTITDGQSEFVGSVAPDEPLVYTYRQSIYQVTVYEDLARTPDGVRIMRARSRDIRSIEYFGWKGEPAQDTDGLWTEDAPASVAADRELVIRITPAGEQRFATARWSLVLKPEFGETVVRVRLVDRPWLIAALEGAR